MSCCRVGLSVNSALFTTYVVCTSSSFIRLIIIQLLLLIFCFSNYSDVPWRLRFAWCGRNYGVVYGSPCGRPEKVCLFILPWLALRRTGLFLKRTVVILSWVALKRTWMTRHFGQVDCPSSGVARRGRCGCIIRRYADAEVITRMWSAPRGLLRTRVK